jgi:hypothetical protein
MALTIKQKMFRQLVRYRCFISANDGALHHRYTQYLHSINAAPRQFDSNGHENPAYYMFYDASTFREELYINTYNALLDGIKRLGRYDYALSHGVCWLRVHLWVDEFEIAFDGQMFMPVQDSKFVKHIIHSNYKDEWKSLAHK